jgi:hypothetical protein
MPSYHTVAYSAGVSRSVSRFCCCQFQCCLYTERRTSLICTDLRMKLLLTMRSSGWYLHCSSQADLDETSVVEAEGKGGRNKVSWTGLWADVSKERKYDPKEILLNYKISQQMEHSLWRTKHMSGIPNSNAQLIGIRRGRVHARWFTCVTQVDKYGPWSYLPMQKDQLRTRRTIQVPCTRTVSMSYCNLT